MAPTDSAASAAGQRSATVTGIGLMVLTMLLFVSMDSIVKSLSTAYPVPQLVWARFTFVLALFLPWLLRRGVGSIVRTRHPWQQGLRGVLMVASTICAFFTLKLLPLADATALFFAAPLIVTALSALWLGEHVGPRRWGGVAVGFVGVLMIVRPGSGLLGWEIVFPLGVALCFGAYQIVTRRTAADGPATQLFYSVALGAVLTTLAVPGVWQPPTLSAWGLFAAIGALAAAGHLCLIRALTLASPVVVSPFHYSQIIWATLFGVIFFETFPDAWTLAGAALIAGSGLYILYRERVRKPAPRAAGPAR